MISEEDLQEGEIVGVVEEEDRGWNTYKLSDGTVIQVKFVLTSVIRTKKRNPDGTPVYAVSGTTMVRTVKVPNELREKTVKKKEPSEVT
ncbi:hypothetical protein [Candidatus Methanodesulfokora washburnensis]|uniref:Uncharacterized protein n=1 Tax=Candidatus Methanodesulfokora washburnensis TaxID=2478471 RepID=A0A429GYQ6_9CREN|nr:hypothetical protein [Candidatus Methanodesulfokores washburnensis]RSN79019.1 hypothetical protein D6D85_00345 [Candidatus Methanodesulfokores washburnensis]